MTKQHQFDICYNCGISLNTNNKTVEHIPARNLYLDCKDEYKKNLLTVPACKECNFEYSKIDQEFRDALGVANDNLDKDQVITQKAARSIMRKADWKERIIMDNNQFVGVKFDHNKFETLHEKNFKGIFYREFGSPLSKYEYEINIFSSLTKDHLVSQNLMFHLESKIEWKISGHADIFKYKISPFNFDERKLLCLTDNLENSLGVWSTMIIHKRIKCDIIITSYKVNEKVLDNSNLHNFTKKIK